MLADEGDDSSSAAAARRSAAAEDGVAKGEAKDSGRVRLRLQRVRQAVRRCEIHSEIVQRLEAQRGRSEGENIERGTGRVQTADGDMLD